MKRKTTTEVVTKALARSGPEITPSQIRLDDSVQTDNNKVFTQSDVNQSMGSGGGGGGGIAPDLDGYVKTEELAAEADARDTGDKANLGLIQSVSAKVDGNTTEIQKNTAAIAALDTSGEGPDLSGFYTKPETDEKFSTKAELLQDHEAWTLADEKIKEAYIASDTALATSIAEVANDLDAVENDYTTTAEFNTLNSKVSQNKKDIASLGEAFDTAVLAAQDGADALNIELQSYAKKDDTYTKPETDTTFAKLSGADFTGDVKADKYIAGQDFRNGPLTDVGVEVDGQKGIVHLKGQSNAVTPIEVFESGSNVNNVSASVFKVTNEGACKAKSFEGDGSKLTGLPTGGAVGINEVLTEGNNADPGQSLNFGITQGDIPPFPFTRDSIDFDAGSGLRLGGLATYYTMNEPFSVDTENGVTQEFAYSTRRLSAVDDYYHAESRGGTTISTGVGVAGIFFRGSNGFFDVGNGTGVLTVGDPDAPILNIEARTYDGTSSITAGEFIGDGSKLTNLPITGGSALPGQKWNLVTAHALPPSPGEMMWVDGDNALYCHATTADGIVLGNASTNFGQYDVNGTMIIAMYKQGLGVEAVFKAATVQMMTQNGQTFWKFLKTNHARFNLSEGTSYNVTASGLF